MKKLILICYFVLTVFALAGNYTVKSGDTLNSIAQKQLGDKSRWREIAAINKLKEPYTLKEGQVILLPEVVTDEHDSVEEIIKTSLPDEHASPEEIINTSLPDEHASPEEIIEASKADSAENSEIDLSWTIIILLLFLSWLYWSIGFKAGCWFSLVEISWKKSFLFPLFMMIGLVIVGFAAKLLAGLEFKTVGTVVSWLAVFYGAAMLITIVFMKKYLDCKWRSIFTVFIMTSVLANILVALSIFALSSATGDVDFVQKIIDHF